MDAKKYGVPVVNSPLIAVAIVALASAQAQTPKYTAKNPPRFQDFPVVEIWQGPPAPLKLITGSERMFKTKLTEATKQSASFAGHYTMAGWGCGSMCGAAAFIDLKTGDVYQPPLATPNGTGWDRWIMCPGLFEGTGDEFHVDSRLMIVRCGMNYSDRLQTNIPDTWYFVWEPNRFREVFFVSGKEPTTAKQ
jgi:hypothetical protein